MNLEIKIVFTLGGAGSDKSKGRTCRCGIMYSWSGYWLHGDIQMVHFSV